MSADIEQNKEIVEEVKVEEKPVEEIKEDEKSEEVSEKLSEEKSEEKTAEKEELSEEEPKEEEKVEEVKEEVVEEKKAEEVVEEVEEKSEKEELQAEITETKEELNVINEVREELVCLYAQNKDNKATIETLSANTTSLEKENAELKEQLGRYLSAEAEIKAKNKVERLEKLSANFKMLGQDKTVEQLSKKDDATLEEFEQLTAAAIDKSLENKEMPEIVNPSQGAEEPKPLSEEKPSEEKVEEKKEALNAQPVDFFANLCNKLSEEQAGNTYGKKIITNL